MSAADPRRGTRTDILGVSVSAETMEEALATIEDWIEQRSNRYVCVAGAHGVMESRRDPRLRTVLNAADMVTPDGQPLVWFSRLLRGMPTERVYGPDLMRALTAISAQRGYRQFYYGGPPGVAETLQQVMVRNYPALQVVGTHCPPFRELTPEEDEAVVARINEARPDIVWVGLSTPKQEFWMASHLGRIDVPVMIGVGAAFDFLAGTKRQAPKWMQRSGLEWSFRLLSEPRRLGRRYAYIVPGFALLALHDIVVRALASGLTQVDRR